MRALAFCLALVTPLPAQAAALSCSFEQECFNTLECTETAHEIAVDLDAGKVSAVTGDLDIIAVHDAPLAKTAVLQGFSGYQLLTMSRFTWILSVHIAAGPAVATYYGECGAD